MVNQAAGGATGFRGRLAEAVAASVDQIEDVQRSKGLTVATLYPGGRVDGVVLSAQLVTVHIGIDEARYGDDLRKIGASVAQRTGETLRALGDTRAVAIRIHDLLPADALKTDTN